VFRVVSSGAQARRTAAVETGSPVPAGSGRKRISVIGGGITGLAAAYRLQRSAQERSLPLDITLFEADARLGGKVHTVRDGEFVLEAGPDSFLASKPQALQLCAELGLGERLSGTNEAQRRTFIYSKGRLHDLPEGFSGLAPSRVAPLMRSGLLSPLGKARLLMDYMLPPRPAGGDESVAAFMRRRLGREAFDRMLEPLLSGIYAGNADQLSLAATFPQLRQMELSRGGLMRGVARTQPKAAQSNGAAQQWTGFVSLRGGMGELVDALADRLCAALRTGRRVESIARTPGGWEVRADGQSLEADAVIVTTPAYATAALLEPVDTRLADLHRAIPHGSTATVSLAFRSAELHPPPEGFGFVVPAIEPRPLLACTFVSNKFAGRAPGGMCLVRCFLGRAGGEQLLEQDDAALIAVARAELKAILGIDAEPLWARLFRWPRGMPQYNLGHLERVAQIESALADHPGLFAAGAAYRGVGIPDCIRSADEAAERTLRFLGQN